MNPIKRAAMTFFDQMVVTIGIIVLISLFQLGDIMRHREWPYIAQRHFLENDVVIGGEWRHTIKPFEFSPNYLFGFILFFLPIVALLWYQFVSKKKQNEQAVPMRGKEVYPFISISVVISILFYVAVFFLDDLHGVEGFNYPLFVKIAGAAGILCSAVNIFFSRNSHSILVGMTTLTMCFLGALLILMPETWIPIWE